MEATAFGEGDWFCNGESSVQFAASWSSGFLLGIRYLDSLKPLVYHRTELFRFDGLRLEERFFVFGSV
jgi:hypothetical protein